MSDSPYSPDSPPNATGDEDQLSTQIDPEAATQVYEHQQETQIDPDLPTQAFVADDDDEEATQVIQQEEEEEEFGETQIDTDAATQVQYEEEEEESGTQIDMDAPTQMLVDDETVTETQIDPEAPTQVMDEDEVMTENHDAGSVKGASDDEENTQIATDAPTQIPENSQRSRSGSPRSSVHSRSVSRSPARSRSGSPREAESRARSRSRSSAGSARSKSGSRSRSRSVGGSDAGSGRARRRSRSGSRSSRSGGSSSRSRSRSGSRASSVKSGGSRRSSRRSRSGSRRSRSGSSRSSGGGARSRSRSGGSVSDAGSDMVNKKKKKRVRAAFGDSDEESGAEGGSSKRRRSGSEGEPEEGVDVEGKEAEEGGEGGQAESKPADSSDDDGVNKDNNDEDGGSGANQALSDFDLMMERKRSEKRKRRRRKDIDLINDNDDAIAKMIADMRLAAREDRELNQQRQPATKKISMLGVVMTQLNKADLQMAFIEANVLSVLTDWLAPMPDKSLPSKEIRRSILKLLFELHIDDQSRLKESGIGKAVMYLYKHPKELRQNKDLAGKIINSWARPIFNLSTDFKSVSKEERMQRDVMMDSRRNKEEKTEDQETALRPGDPGWCYRARVPQAQASNYVRRPEWTSNVDISRVGKKSATRLDKQLRNLQKRKDNSKTKRAVAISINGGKMAL